MWSKWTARKVLIARVRMLEIDSALQSKANADLWIEHEKLKARIEALEEPKKAARARQQAKQGKADGRERAE